MGQIIIHLDAKSEAKAMRYAKMMNIPLDKWIADLIMKKTSVVWPESVKNFAGSWSDFPMLEEIRADIGIDSRRENL